MATDMGTKLKALRGKTSLSAKDVSLKLKELGFEISDKTLHGYEGGFRMPSADVFMALCEIYGCKNILETFKDIEIDYSIPSDSEWQMIEKYRALDSYGSDLVDVVLNKEYIRCQDSQNEKVLQFSLERKTGEFVARNGKKISDDLSKQLQDFMNQEG